MKLFAKQNRELIMINAQNTQNENDAEKIILQVPEQYEDFNKKIVFVTPDGNVWDIITNNEYLIPKAITKYKQVDFYIWLTQGNVDFRSQTKTLKFYHNVDASGEITPEEISGVNTVVNLLEEEITKVNNLETEIDGKLEEIDTAIDNVSTAIQETENLDLDAEKVGQTTTVTLTKKDGTVKTVHIDDGVDLQFMWQGTSLGIKTTEQAEYTFVDLQGIQGPAGPQGEPFTIKKTYSSVTEMNADFNNMQLGDYVMIASTVEVEDNAKLYTRGENQWIFITDFSGATGIRGETGLTPNIQIGTVTQGSSFNVTRTGTNENPVLNFTLVKGDKGDPGQTGATGNGIASITKTATSGLVDTYTITYTNGNTTTFTVTNGEDANTTDISKIKEEQTTQNGNISKNADEITNLKNENSYLQNVVKQAFTETSASGTELTINNTIEARMEMKLNGNTSQNGEPTPTTPQDIEVVTGDNTITISNSDNTEKQEFPISLGSLELCKIGDYQDYFYKSGSKWYLHKEVDKDIVDENNKIAITNPNTSNWYYQITPKKITLTASQTNQICNYYPNREIFNGNTNQGILKISNGTQIRIRYGTEDTVANFKTWLASNNIILYSLLATATNTEITDTTLTTQLDEISQALSQKGTTIISQNNDDSPFNLDVIALTK